MRNMSPAAKRRLRFGLSYASALLILFSAFAVIPSVAGAQTTQRRRNRFEYTIRNNSRYVIRELYFETSENDQWGPDRLGSNVLPVGQSFRLTNIIAGEYDMKLVDQDGDECQLFNIMVCGNGTYNITNENLLRCEGYR